MATRYWIFRDGETEPIGGHFETEGAAEQAKAMLEQETPDDQGYEVATTPKRRQ